VSHRVRKAHTKTATHSKAGQSQQLYLSQYDHDKGVWIARG